MPLSSRPSPMPFTSICSLSGSLNIGFVTPLTQYVCNDLGNLLIGSVCGGVALQEDTSQSRSKVNQGWQEQKARKEGSLPHSGHRVAPNLTRLALALLEEGRDVGRLSQVASGSVTPSPKLQSHREKRWRTQRQQK